MRGRKEGNARRERAQDRKAKNVTGRCRKPERDLETEDEKASQRERETQNGCVFIHNFLFIQIARWPSGQPRSPRYISEGEGLKTGGRRRGDRRWSQVKEGGDGGKTEKEKEASEAIQPAALILLTAGPGTLAPWSGYDLCRLMMAVLWWCHNGYGVAWGKWWVQHRHCHCNGGALRFI